MNKKLFAVVCIALLVLSFAAARVINLSVGPSFSFYTGKFPLDEEGSATGAYKGTGFGLDTAFDLTFGERAELYFQDSILFSGKAPSAHSIEG